MSINYRRLKNDYPEFDSFSEMIDFAAEKYGSKTAFEYIDNDIHSISFDKFRDHISAVASFFKNKGLKNDHIALLGANSYEYIVVFYGILCSGNIAVPICKDLDMDDLEVILNDCAPSFVVILDGVRTREADILSLAKNSEIVNMDKVRKTMESDGEFTSDRVISSDACCCIVYTSGTSGRPKGVMLTAKGILRNAVSVTRNIDLADKVLLCLPLHHMFACVTSMIMPVICGSTVIINLNGKKLLNDMGRFSPDDVFLVPAIAEFIYKRVNYLIRNDAESEKYIGILNGNDIASKSFSERREIFRKFTIDNGISLRRIVSGAAMLDSSVVAFLEKIGIETLCGYGMTECSPVISVNMSGANKYGSIGFPLDCNEVRIMNNGSDNNGEIQIKGDNVMLGYYNMKTETDAVFEDGWLKTGDVGYIDDEGYLYISGRIKNLMIRSSGENVSPEELETRISVMNGVSEVIVHESNGLFIASIFPDDNSEENRAKINNSISEMNKTLPSFKRIDKVEFTEKCFEKTSTNKIKRNI